MSERVKDSPLPFGNKSPGSGGKEFPWPSGMEKKDQDISLAANEFYELWKELFKTKADFAEQKRRIDLFYEFHKENGVTEWMEEMDPKWKIRHAAFLKQKAHQDWQKERGKQS